MPTNIYLTPGQEKTLRQLIMEGKRGEAVAKLRQWMSISQQAAERIVQNLDSIA